MDKTQRIFFLQKKKVNFLGSSEFFMYFCARKQLIIYKPLKIFQLIMKVKSLLFVGIAMMGIAFTSCSKEENLFDNEAAQANRMEKYAENFVKKYGPIDPNQTWDFASMEPVYLPASFNNTTTRSDFSVITRTDDDDNNMLLIDKPVLSWMFTNMKAGRDNHEQGKPFTFNAPSNSFTVVPIFQGNASYYWELYINLGSGEKQRIWSKGSSLSYTTATTPNPADKTQWTSVGIEREGILKTATAVLAPTKTFTLPSMTSFYFSLKIWSSKDDFDDGKDPREVTTLSNKMLALPNAQIPATVPEGYTATVIGCEDASDNDFEDLVFMVYGKPVPSIQYEEDVTILQAKRYMIEDLGGDDDYDFNDIVIDVQRYKTQHYEYAGESVETAELVSEYTVPGSEGQRAILRAAGGTLKFTIKIGKTSWSKSELGDWTKMLNTGWQGSEIDYNANLATIQLNPNDWIAEENNIEVTVEGSNGIYGLSFPEPGHAPVMVTKDTTLDNWMNERQPVSKEWLTTNILK